MSQQGKRGLVSLGGEGTTCEVNSPVINEFLVNRIREGSNYFCFPGRLDKINCVFRIDTGSDVSIVNRKLVAEGKEEICEENYNLRYPTGEKVSVGPRVILEVYIGKNLVEIPMFVVEMSEDCILGVDFLKAVKLENIFESAFGSSEEKIFNCSRIKDSSVKVPLALKEFFENSSKSLWMIPRKKFS